MRETEKEWEISSTEPRLLAWATEDVKFDMENIHVKISRGKWFKWLFYWFKAKLFKDSKISNGQEHKPRHDIKYTLQVQKDVSIKLKYPFMRKNKICTQMIWILMRLTLSSWFSKWLQEYFSLPSAWGL